MYLMVLIRARATVHIQPHWLTLHDNSLEDFKKGRFYGPFDTARSIEFTAKRK